MTRRRIMGHGLAVWAAWMAVSGAHAGESPPINRLEGVVVSADGGAPVADVPVVLVHTAKGYLTFDSRGWVAQAQADTLFGIFPLPNGQHACRTVTDADGRFVLRGFAAGDERWVIATGDPQRGYALRARVNPKDLATQPLKLELQTPAYVELDPPKAPGHMLVYVGAALAREPDGSTPVADDETDDRVLFSGSYQPESAGKARKLGPLPAGQWYKVTARGSSNKLSYTPILFERLVKLAPGETASASYEPTEGATVTGRISGVDDKPLGRVNVTVRTADGLVIGAVTDEQGKYELRGVPPGAHTLKLLRHAKRTAPG